VEDIEKILKQSDEQREALLEQQQRIYEAHKLDPVEGEDVIEEIIRIGPGDHQSYVVAVPNDSLGLLIGKNSDTLKMIKTMSEADRLQIANEGVAGSSTRNMFIYGSVKAFEKAREMICEIVEKHKQLKCVNNLQLTSKLASNTLAEPVSQTKQTIELSIPNNMGFFFLNLLTTSRPRHRQKRRDHQVHQPAHRRVRLHPARGALRRGQ